MTPPVVGYAGMTHLGLCSAAAAAERGCEVVGFDPDPEHVAALRAGRLPVVEPELPELIERHAGRLRFDSEAAALRRCDVVYVAADVPTDDTGASDLSGIRALLERIDHEARADAARVILSQVPPGFTRRSLGRSVRDDRVLYYQVETLIFGRGVERALEPERFIIGCADPVAELAPAYASFLELFDCPVLRMRYESAELAKLAINACLVAHVSTANTLAELCEGLGARWFEIAPALRLDRRIGAHAYLEPGLGLAGGNLERDLATLCQLAGEHGTDASVVRAWLANSRQRRDWVLRVLHAELLGRVASPCVALLGLAYKRDTASTKNAPALALLEALPGVVFRAWDPAVASDAVVRSGFERVSEPLEACHGADAVCLLTPWPELAKLDPAELARALRGRLVVDPQRLLDARACATAGLDHFALGAPATRAAAV
jgi:UDPglucose 6-dehydrogenase